MWYVLLMYFYLTIANYCDSNSTFTETVVQVVAKRHKM